MADEELTTEAKARILDILVTHAETIRDGKWIEGKLIDLPQRLEIESHAKYFLRIYQKAVKRHLIVSNNIKELSRG